MKVATIALLACATVLAGCQTAKRTSTESVRFISQPSGATITTSLGESCKAPCSMVIKRRKEFTATASRKGYRSQTITVKRKVNRKVFGKTLASGIVPGGSILIATDTISGSFYDHEPNPVRFRLKRR